MNNWTCSIKLYTTKLVIFFLDLITNFILHFWYGKPKKLPPIRNPLLLEPAVKLAAKIRKKQLKCVDLMKAYIDRVKEVQPFINAATDPRFKEALEDARKVDEFMQNNSLSEEELQKEKPLLGIPFTVKESIAVKGLHLSAGLVSRKNIIADSDADTVAEMKKAGAIPLSMTNVPELCVWFDASNNIYGQTNNPYNTRRIPGGSSGGEGALISSAGSILGIGTDIGGSIRVPSCFSGIFGHKPSKGVVSNRGGLPELEGDLPTYNCTGPMCRYASDLKPVLKVLAGKNVNKLNLDAKVNIKNLKVYYMEDSGGSNWTNSVDPEIRAALRKVVKYLESSYGIKPQKVNIKNLKHSGSIYLATIYSPPYPLTKIMAGGKGEISLPMEWLKWCLNCSDHMSHALFVATIQKYVAPKVGSKKYYDALEKHRALKEEIDNLLENDCIFLYPTNPVLAPYYEQTIYKFANYSYTGIFNVLGLPSTQCPLGLASNGIPIGIQVIANIHNDHLTLALASELENAFKGWTSPSPIF